MSKRPAGAKGIIFNHEDDCTATLKDDRGRKVITARDAALMQRDALEAAAVAIAAGELPENPRWIASVLRQAAAAIPEREPRKKGRPPKIDHGALAFRYAWLRVHQQMDDSAALHALEYELAFEHVSYAAISNALTEELKAEALRQFEGNERTKPQLIATKPKPTTKGRN